MDDVHAIFISPVLLYLTWLIPLQRKTLYETLYETSNAICVTSFALDQLSATVQEHWIPDAYPWIRIL